MTKTFKAAMAGLTALGGIAATEARAADLPPVAPNYNKAPVIPQAVNFDARFGRFASDFMWGGMTGVIAGGAVQFEQKNQTFNQVGTSITTYAPCGCALDNSGFSFTNSSSSIDVNRVVKGAWIGGLVGGGVYTGIDMTLLTFGIDKERMSFVPKAGIEIGSSIAAGISAAFASRQWGGVPTITNTFQDPSFAVCAPCGGITPTYLGEGVQITNGKRMSDAKTAEMGFWAGLATGGFHATVDSLDTWGHPQYDFRAAGMSYKVPSYSYGSN